MTSIKYTIQQPISPLPLPIIAVHGDKDQPKALSQSSPYRPSPVMYFFIFGAWILSMVHFEPRLLQLLDFATSTTGKIVLMFFIGFINFAWLYGFYNVGVVLFALYFKKWHAGDYTTKAISKTFTFPSVALLYTTCNDFVEESAESCVRQDYADYKVYILDDSSDPEYQDRVDAFATRHKNRVIVVRRPDRVAFKAGNMNYGLTHFAKHEKYFAIADADEILPDNFLSKLVPVMETDERCGFVQANHRANPYAPSTLAKSLGIGIDIHWKWYQPLRNKYGFVMFLGHGALLRRKCWEEIGGFPDIVSEDLGFAIHSREKGYHGRFVEDVICYEDFPDTVRAFRIRHMKWTKGTCEFLAKKFKYLVTSRNISWVEKLDILFPTMNLPLTLLYLLFMVNANLFIPLLFGTQTELTFVIAGQNVHMPIITLDPRFQVIFAPDFFAITMLTFFAPVLCFILELFTRPLTLIRFLGHSTALYAALSPLSSLGVISYMVSGKAVFLVTGEKKQAQVSGLPKEKKPAWGKRMKKAYHDLISKSHPDQGFVQAVEIGMGVTFGVACVLMFQISFFGLCLAFMLLPLMHHLPWSSSWVKSLVFLPFMFIMLGVLTAGLSVFGMQAVFFGYGFHF
jgi:cellulose synthase/poly-beta-1,6-N-acetylglucosamine synthase-like glycosyltransferase